jgi:hypothetical protein
MWKHPTPHGPDQLSAVRVRIDVVPPACNGQPPCRVTLLLIRRRRREGRRPDACCHCAPASSAVACTESTWSSADSSRIRATSRLGLTSQQAAFRTELSVRPHDLMESSGVDEREPGDVHQEQAGLLRGLRAEDFRARCPAAATRRCRQPTVIQPVQVLSRHPAWGAGRPGPLSDQCRHRSPTLPAAC